ncbi:PP2C family protein-serine/threonine phosphatase [Anaerobiospirillum succiniciproducens]|uniref:PP2C family protein-serine/threonine phosphatase n=1 Tax=Anaerobiospirillum succiniciproducens TaxID=13335 RepID=UPI00248E81B6|nr:PP2C family protein-serine/threonine phosphatase [Anaerobiospirillum succiniciproducens]
MIFRESGMARRALRYATITLFLPLIFLLIFTWAFWSNVHLNQEKLVQNNVAQLFNKELDNAFIFNQISRHSSLTLVRNELQRLHRMVDLSIYDMLDESTASDGGSLLKNLSTSLHNIQERNAAAPKNTLDTFDTKSEDNVSGSSSQQSITYNQDVQDVLNKDRAKSAFVVDAAINPTNNATPNIASEDDAAELERRYSRTESATTTRDDLSLINAALDKRNAVDGVSGASKGTQASGQSNSLAVDQNHGIASHDAASTIIEKSSAYKKAQDNPKIPSTSAANASKESEDASVKELIAYASGDVSSTPEALLGKVLSDEYLEDENKKHADTVTENKRNLTNVNKRNYKLLQEHLKPTYNHSSKSNGQRESLFFAESNPHAYLDHDYQDNTHAKAQDQKLYKLIHMHLEELHRLSFEAFVINKNNPSEDVFLDDSHRYMLSELYNQGSKRNLFSFIVDASDKKTDSFSVMYRDISDQEYEMFMQSYKKNHDLRILENVQNEQSIEANDTDDFIASEHKLYVDAMTAASALATRDHKEAQYVDEQHIHTAHVIQPRPPASIAPGNSSPIVHDEININKSDVTRRAAYLVSASPLSNLGNLQLVLISDISRLHKQDIVLKRLIAYSINETVKYASDSTSLQILLIDSDYNSLTDTAIPDELIRSIPENVLNDAKVTGISQHYDPNIDGYITIRHFAPANWFIIVSGGDNNNHTNLTHYLLITGLVGLLLCFTGLALFLKHSKKDAADIETINNKLRHMAGLLQDSDLLDRISKDLPERNDEIGTLSKRVLLMTKSLYQYTQSLQNVSGDKLKTSIKELKLQKVQNESENNLSKLKLKLPENMAIYSKRADSYTGDYFDYFKLSNDFSAVVIGTVNRTGKTAYDAASLNLMLTSQLVELCSRKLINLGEAVTILNKQLFSKYEGKTLSSMCIILIDKNTNCVTLLNAGHTLPVIKRKDKTFGYIDIRSDVVLGSDKNQCYSSYDIYIDEGDSILLYTDGILDFVNHHGKKLGGEGFEEMLSDESFDSAKDTVHNLKKKLLSFANDVKQENDCTIICCKF